MGKLALFLESLVSRVFTYMVIKVGVNLAAKLAIVFYLSAMYVALMTTFNAFVEPLISRLFSTDFGMVIGLAFPPVAGTVASGLFALWGAATTYRYFLTFGQILAPK